MTDQEWNDESSEGMVECPYCGKIFAVDDYVVYDDGSEGEEECPTCEKVFDIKVKIVTEFLFSARKIQGNKETKSCENCKNFFWAKCRTEDAEETPKELCDEWEEEKIE